MELPLWACLLIMGLLLGVVHWFPWLRELPKLVTYSLGTAIIWAGVYLYNPRNDLLWFPFVAGVATFGMWGIDWLLDWVANVYLVWKRGRRDQRSDTSNTADV